MYLDALVFSNVLCSMLRTLAAAAAVVWSNQQSRNTPVALRDAMCHRTSVARKLACKLLLFVCGVCGCLLALQNPAQNSVRQPVQQQRLVKARGVAFIISPQAPTLSWRCWHALRRSSHSVSSTPVVPGKHRLRFKLSKQWKWLMWLLGRGFDSQATCCLQTDS